MKEIVATLAVVVIGLAVGFALSTIQFRLTSVKAPIEFTVDGQIGSPVVVNVDGEIDFSGDNGLSPVSTIIDTVGTGRTIVEGGQVLTRLTTFSLQKNTEIKETDTSYVSAQATPDELGAYFDTIVGQTESSRIVLLTPETTSAAIITVVDILPTIIPSNYADTSAHDGLPAVGTGSAGIPVILAGGGAIEEIATASLTAGAGEQIEAGDTVVINYILASTTGEEIENTWSTPEPVIVNVDDLFTGLRTSLLDSRVGSRLILAIPAEDAQGEDDVAFVIDVLAKLPQDEG